AGEGKSADTGRRVGGSGSGLQHAVGGGVVRTGRGGGRFARAGVGLGGGGIRNELGGVAAAAGEWSRVAGGGRPVGESVGIAALWGSRRGRRTGFGRVHGTAAQIAGVVSEAAEENGVVPAGSRRNCGWSHGLVRAASHGRGLQIRGGRA